MYRDKTIIRLRKEGIGFWEIRLGKRRIFRHRGISRLLRLISTLVQDKDKVYAIDIIVKRRR